MDGLILKRKSLEIELLFIGQQMVEQFIVYMFFINMLHFDPEK